MRTILCAVVLLLPCALVSADNITNGYVADGYTYHEGWWWRGNDAYSRQLVTTPGYYQYGHYYPGASSYQYTYSYTYKPTVTAKDPGWRAKLLELAAQRDKFEGQIRKNAIEQQYFSAAIKQLGLEGNFHWQNYGVSPAYQTSGYSGYGQLSLSSAGVNGSTIYGYSYNKIADLYGDKNLALLYQSAARNSENAKQVLSEANTGILNLAGLEGQNRAKVAEILAKGQAVQEFLRAMQEPGARIEEKQYSFKVVPGKDGQVEVQKVDPPQINPQQQAGGNFAAFQAHTKQECGACHHGGKKAGGLDLDDWRNFSVERKLEVVERLITPDQAKRMPRKADGSVGAKMTADKVALYLTN